MKLIVESKTQTPEEIETVMCKAVKSMKKLRDNRPFEAELQNPISVTNALIDKILDNMIQELSDVLDGD